MSKVRRGSWIWYAAIATVLLTVWTMIQTEDEPVTSRSDRRAGRRADKNMPVIDSDIKNNADSVENVRLDLLVRDKESVNKTNPFSSPVLPRLPAKKELQSPAIEAPPPPPPTAPAMPFNYFGRYEDGSKRVVMLVKDGKIYTISEGVNLDNSYRVVKIEEGSIDIIYLPLGIMQTIDISDSATSSKR